MLATTFLNNPVKDTLAFSTTPDVLAWVDVPPVLVKSRAPVVVSAPAPVLGGPSPWPPVEILLPSEAQELLPQVTKILRQVRAVREGPPSVAEGWTFRERPIPTHTFEDRRLSAQPRRTRVAGDVAGASGPSTAMLLAGFGLTLAAGVGIGLMLARKTSRTGGKA